MHVLKIGAVWCPACLVMRPRWALIEKEFPNITTSYLEFDEAHPLIHAYNVNESVLPVFIFLNEEGEEIKRMNGEVSKEAITQFITSQQS